MWIKIVFLILAIHVHGLFSQVSAASLADAIQQLQSWEDKIVSIRVRTRSISIAESDSLLREAGKSTGVLELDWIWEDSGRYLEKAIGTLDGQVSGRILSMGDVKRSYHLGYPGDNPGAEMPTFLTISENSRQNASTGLSNPPLQIVWEGKTRTWLGTRLATLTDAKVTRDGLLEVDGEEVGSTGSRVLLDPQHGYLPKLVEYPSTGGGKPTQFTTDEFRELEPGFWFPWKGANSWWNGDVRNWEVQQVDLNTELPDSLFAPPLSDEMYVHNTLTGKQYWHGGKPPAREVARVAALKAAAAKATPVAGNPNPLTGLPDRPGNWSMWLVVLGIVCVSGGVWIRRRG